MQEGPGLVLGAGAGHLGYFLIEFGTLFEVGRVWKGNLDPFWAKVANNPAPKRSKAGKRGLWCHPWGPLFEVFWVPFSGLDPLWEHFGIIFAPCGCLLVSTSNFDSENSPKLTFSGVANVAEV